MMKDLRKKFQSILEKHGATAESINSVNVTRLKEIILAEIPDLFEEKKGKYVILTSRRPLGESIFEASMSPRTEGGILYSAAKIIRKYMFEHDEFFDGDLSQDRQKQSVPRHLLLLLGLILEDCNDSTISNAIADISLKLAQLVRFNAVKRKRSGDAIRHTKNNEPPLPVMVGLSIHSKTREKRLIEDLYSKGLSISYDRVIEIEDNITKRLCNKYNEEGVVCPPALEPGLFTCAAIDNIDHNPSSSTSKTSYHGTSISIFQYPTESTIVQPFQYSDVFLESVPLPISYTEIKPTKDFKPEPPNRSNENLDRQLENEVHDADDQELENEDRDADNQELENEDRDADDQELEKEDRDADDQDLENEDRNAYLENEDRDADDQEHENEDRDADDQDLENEDRNSNLENEDRDADDQDIEKELKKMDHWLEELSKLETSNDLDVKTSFSAYFDERSISSMPKTTSTLLPLLNESINSTAMVRQCIEIIQGIIKLLNPSQKVVITADQPVYVLGKRVQWMYPEKYHNAIWLMGPLHIEMSYMSAIGSWLRESGWIEAFEKSNLTTPGRIESFLNGSNVKRCRYAHQVSLAALTKLAEKAFETQQEFTDYEAWEKQGKKQNSNISYWFHVMEMETLLFAFIKSLRDADFPAFLNSLKMIARWMFILDHTHYARWLPVFIKDLQDLDLDTLDQFKKGYFIIKRSKNTFSNMGIDQAHEQNNKLIKIHGGAIGIFDNPKALLRWSVSGSIIADMCNVDSKDHNAGVKHHENTSSFEVRFRKDVDSLYAAIIELGNPFQEKEKNLVQLSTKAVLDSEVSNSVRLVGKLGKQQYESFVKDRLLSNRKSLYNIVHKNKVQLFKHSNLSVPSKSRQKIKNLVADRKLFSRLFIACQSRAGDLENFLHAKITLTLFPYLSMEKYENALQNLIS